MISLTADPRHYRGADKHIGQSSARLVGRTLSSDAATVGSGRQRCNEVWYVYYLELATGDIYVGSTDDLKRRYRSHSLGQVTSTRPFLQPELKCYVAVETEVQARPLDRCFKSGSSRALAKKCFW